MFGDFLYQLSLKDQHSLGIELYKSSVTRTGVATSYIVNAVQVPQDRVLVLQAIVVIATPNVGVTTSVNCAVRTGRFTSATTVPDNPYYIAASMLGADLNAAGYSGVVQYGIEFDNMLIPSGAGLMSSAGFNAVDAANAAQMDVYGYTIPRGNIAL